MKRSTITNLLKKKYKISHDRRVAGCDLPCGGVQLETIKDYLPVPTWKVTSDGKPYQCNDYKLMSTGKLEVTVQPYMKLFGDDIEMDFTIDDIANYLTENNIEFTRKDKVLTINIE